MFAYDLLVKQTFSSWWYFQSSHYVDQLLDWFEISDFFFEVADVEHFLLETIVTLLANSFELIEISQ